MKYIKNNSGYSIIFSEFGAEFEYHLSSNCKNSTLAVNWCGEHYEDTHSGDLVSSKEFEHINRLHGAVHDKAMSNLLKQKAIFEFMNSFFLAQETED